MAYKLIFVKDDAGVIIRYSGTVSDEDVVRSVKEVFASPDQTRSYRYIIPDFSKADQNEITQDGIRENSLVVIEASKLNKRIALAVVAPTNFRLIMPRMWQTYMDKTGWRTKLVKTLAKAQDWVKTGAR